MAKLLSGVEVVMKAKCEAREIRQLGQSVGHVPGHGWRVVGVGLQVP